MTPASGTIASALHRKSAVSEKPTILPIIVIGMKIRSMYRYFTVLFRLSVFQVSRHRIMYTGRHYVCVLTGTIYVY